MYYLFTYDGYYPSGGAHDFVDRFNSIESALQYIKDSNSYNDYYQIADSSMEIVESGSIENLKKYG